MKKIWASLVVFALILSVFSGCSGKKLTNGIQTESGHFKITSENLLTNLNSLISGNYKKLPALGQEQQDGNMVDSSSEIGEGANLRITADKANNQVTEITLSMDITKISPDDMNLCGYYLGIIALAINPDVKTDFAPLKTSELNANDLRTMMTDKAFYVMVLENGVVQIRVYPIA